MKKIYFSVFALLVAISINAQTPIYFLDFESGVEDATIVGCGAIESDTTTGFGSVFHNAVDSQALRNSYLLLPDTIFAQVQESGTHALSIGVWVNLGTATDSFYCPLFTAYGAAPVAGANTWPMMALQVRFWVQVNCAGWTDLGNADNITDREGDDNDSTNLETLDWLADEAWHYYTATFTDSTVKVYADAEIQNSWVCDGTEGHTVSGLFTNANDLNYICLGGNQAWNWADEDGAFKFDDLAIYTSELTVSQIEDIIEAKTATDVREMFVNYGELVREEYFSITGARVGSSYEALVPGVYIVRQVYSSGAVKASKIIKTDDF
ncbi:MAG: hypothetical protein JXB49_18485 [Bacteroidales bacterium]|nr:hypothetical protein [Bacteroidales bacterium]